MLLLILCFFVLLINRGPLNMSAASCTFIYNRLCAVSVTVTKMRKYMLRVTKKHVKLRYAAYAKQAQPKCLQITYKVILGTGKRYYSGRLLLVYNATAFAGDRLWVDFCVNAYDDFCGKSFRVFIFAVSMIVLLVDVAFIAATLLKTFASFELAVLDELRSNKSYTFKWRLIPVHYKPAKNMQIQTITATFHRESKPK